MALKDVYSAMDELSAVSVRALLADNGIGSVFRSNVIAGLNFDISGSGGFSYGHILVEEENEEKAKELIAGWQGTLGMLEEQEELPAENPDDYA